MLRITSVVCLALAFFSFPVQAQISTDHNLIRIETPKFKQNLENPNFIYLPMDFNSATANEKLRSVDPAKILSISLVYSQFKASERFDQLQLNSERMMALYRVFPALKDVEEIKWYWIAQTECKSPEACRDYFHGFEIRTISSEEELKSKISTASLDMYMARYRGEAAKSEFLDSLSELPYTTVIKECDTTYQLAYTTTNRLGHFKELNHRSKAKFLMQINKEVELTRNDVVMIIDNDKNVIQVEGVTNTSLFLKYLNRYYHPTVTRMGGERIYTEYTLHFSVNSLGKISDFYATARPMSKALEPLVFEKFNTVYEEVISCTYIDTTIITDMSVIHDHVVTRVMDRNEQWKHCLVVTDVTGSMLPYLGQFLVWHQLNLKSSGDNVDFVFFNDGDNIKDELKVTGKVGGTYYIQTHDFEKLKEECARAQANGGGGDAPENNIEAVLYGLKMNPTVTEVIMLADNKAVPRDLELLYKVNRPIHVILCGAQDGVNVAYLNLVRETGGSIHTIEEDILNLAKISEGESLIIDGHTYRIVGGEFVEEGAPDAFSDDATEYDLEESVFDIVDPE
ncbi:hypothetical protein GYB29_05190 [bacterium]|nr:hypothetical protein [bacterium]